MRHFFLCFSFVFLCACSAQKSKLGLEIASRSDVTETPATDSYVLKLEVSSTWDTGVSSTVHMASSACTISTSDGLGSTKQCAVYIPEYQLFYSKLSIKLDMNKNLTRGCDVVDFQPYFYLASQSAAYFPWYDATTTGLDCSQGSLPAGCYGGAARLMVEGFPKSYGYVMFPSQETSKTFTTINSLSTDSGKSTRAGANNRHLVNSVAVLAGTWSALSSVTGQAVDGYITNTYRPYSASCQDKWGQNLYRIELTISDDATASGYAPPPGYIPSSVKAGWP